MIDVYIRDIQLKFWMVEVFHSSSKLRNSCGATIAVMVLVHDALPHNFIAWIEKSGTSLWHLELLLPIHSRIATQERNRLLLEVSGPASDFIQKLTDGEVNVLGKIRNFGVHYR
jgi:hypothetical protein